MGWIILLLCVGQTDIAFSYCQEEFVYQTCPKQKGEIPAFVKGQIQQLGDTTWSVREQATQKLFKYVQNNPTEIRWLMWGRHDKDPEIALRCNALLRRFYKCSSCKGAGKKKEDYWEHECYECNGIGSLWGLTPWD